MSGIPVTTQSGLNRKKRLGEILSDAGLVTKVQLEAALSEQRKWGGKLGRTLVEMGFVDEQSMTLALSRQLQVPQVDLDALELPAGVLGFLRVDIAERYGVFPIAGDRGLKTVTLATSDPTNVEALQELAFYTGLRVQVAVASGSSVDRAIRRHYYGESTVASNTTTPGQLGVSEPLFDPQQLVATQHPAAPSAPRTAAPASPELSEQLAALNQRMSDLEKVVSGQVRALRGLVELLLEKGVIDREAYVSRVRPRGE
jgi:type IV pilus assembly protein PilB